MRAAPSGPSPQAGWVVVCPFFFHSLCPFSPPPTFHSLSHTNDSVPMKSRAPAQRVQPDVQTGCVCCASGDGRFGGPVWWNTPEEGAGEEGGGTAWAPAEGYGGGGGLEGTAAPPPPPPPSRKRSAPEPPGEGEAGEVEAAAAVAEEEEEDLPDEVKARLAALKG